MVSQDAFSSSSAEDMAGLSHVAMAAATAGGSSKGWPGWSPKTPSPPPTEEVVGLSHVATPTATAGGSSGGRALVEAPLRNFLDNNGEIVATRGQPEIWRRFKEAGSLDQESIERKYRAALVVHVTKLEGESVSLFYLNPRLASAVPCNMDYMQKAWFYNEYGPRAVLQYGDFPVPQMGDNQVLLRVCVVALNPVDLKLRNGVFKDTGLEFPVVPGCDVAGVVVDEGANVSMFSKGDEAHGNIQSFNTVRPKQYGTLTQYTAVEEILIALKPENMPFEEAASFPLALQTAQEGFDRENFQRGQTVFIVGGEGGVGSMAIQVRGLCEKAKEILMEESNVQDGPLHNQDEELDHAIALSLSKN